MAHFGVRNARGPRPSASAAAGVRGAAMFESTPIVEHFARAGLPLSVTAAPLTTSVGRRSIVETARDIVQLDIRREAPHRERFRLWAGHPRNRILVEGIDRKLRQLVLLVDEPRRRFEVEIPRGARANGARVIREIGRRRWIEQWTEGRKRHLLCGMDEAHLFIAGIPRAVSTVRDAHEALRNPGLDSAERHAPDKTVRQGEWFFVALDGAEEQALAHLERRAPIRRRIGIAAGGHLEHGGREHIADELLAGVLPPPYAPTPRVYVRGAVRHPDHRAVVFTRWRRVLPNAEARTAHEGVLWVD